MNPRTSDTQKHAAMPSALGPLNYGDKLSKYPRTDSKKPNERLRISSCLWDSINCQLTILPTISTRLVFWLFHEFPQDPRMAICRRFVYQSATPKALRIFADLAWTSREMCGRCGSNYDESYAHQVWNLQSGAVTRGAKHAEYGDLRYGMDAKQAERSRPVSFTTRRRCV